MAFNPEKAQRDAAKQQWQDLWAQDKSLWAATRGKVVPSASATERNAPDYENPNSAAQKAARLAEGGQWGQPYERGSIFADSGFSPDRSAFDIPLPSTSSAGTSVGSSSTDTFSTTPASQQGTSSMAFNTPFSMPELLLNENNRYEYADANIPWNDNYTAKAQQFGWNSPSAQGNLTRDMFGYQNAQTLHGLNTGFNGLGEQVATGFNDVADKMDYGGVWGQSQNRTYSPQSGNYMNGQSNPFMIGSF